ncbi:MAG: hypothetical protein MPEBLZ_04098 [Candidatus Methanoperedens nitroreducens]|uniref:Fido domain-containing protein n=1 Tax=Candidatus Methanoperedens nitratireducens TaxID=1392998 RepID=A0A0P8ABJ3_9EURY|nr:MAG: hypothetical protein MPEBLZ_04098 [Candidatus Methanoperedens sp. BLZ1]
MSLKIGKNDLCPCGSGKKYKRCCSDSKKNIIKEETPKYEDPHIGRLALVRFGQDLIDEPEELIKISKELEESYNMKSLKDSLLEAWNINKVREMSTSDIIEKLKSMNLNFDIEEFKKQAQNHISSIQLAEYHYYTQDFHAEEKDEDFIWLAIVELWNRIIPERCNIEMIDDLMHAGYKYIEKKDYGNGLENWEKAWKMIITIVPPQIKSVTEADDFMPEPLTQSIYNWCQNFEMELGNRGREGESFRIKRIEYCNEFCRVFPETDKLIIHNMLRAEAESYAALGDIETAEKLFKSLIKRFPENVWGYIGWGDMYAGIGGFRSNPNIPKNHEKAKEIYQSGITHCNTETEAIYERLDDIEKRVSKNHPNADGSNRAAK